MSARTRLAWIGAGACTGVLALGWDLWLLPVLWTAGGAAISTHRGSARAIAATRLATLAQTATTGTITPPTVERLVVADLAARTANAPATLLAARELVGRIHDPWRRALATERIEEAAALVHTRGLPVAGRLTSSDWVVTGCLGCTLASGSVVIASTSGTRWWMVPAVAAMAAVGGAIGALLARPDPFDLAISAAVDPLPVTAFLKEREVIELLAQIGDRKPGAFAHAAAIAAPEAVARLAAAAAHSPASRSGRSR